MGRKARMRRLRRDELDELLEQEQAEAAKAAPQAESEVEPDATKATPQDSPARVLELQKTVGNRAVGAALSRWPVLGTAPLPQWPKEPQMIVDGTAIPIESYQEGIQASSTAGSSTGGHRQNGPGATGPGEIVVMLKLGKHSSAFLMQASRGPGYKTVEIVIPTKDGKGIRFILTDVLISGYSVSKDSDSPLESVSLNFKKREFSQDPPPPGGRR